MDEQHYMDMAVQYYRLLQNPSFNTPRQIIEYIPFRQPGYPLLILPFLLIFGIGYSYQIALLVNGFLYVTSVITFYFLARYFFNETISLLGSIILAAYGWNLFYLHFTYSETATTTFVLLSLYFLLKTDYFRRRKYSLLFAVFFGYGILIRWVTPIFTLGPFLYVIIQGFRKSKRHARLKNLFLALLVVSVIGLWPYLFNIQAFWGSYIKEQLISGPIWQTVPEYRKTHLSLQSAAYYFKIFEQLTIFLFIPFIIGLGLIFLQWKKYIYLVLAFTVPYIVFSFFTVIKDDRYIVPIYPVVALITCVSLQAIRRKSLRLILSVFLMTVSIYNFLGAGWGIGPLGKEGLQSVLLPMPIGHPRRIHFTTLVWPPTKEYANAWQITNTLDEDIKKRNIRNPYIIFLFSYQPIDNAIYSINRYNKLKMYTLDNFVAAETADRNLVNKRIREAFYKADYVITKTGIVTDQYFPEHNYLLLQAMNEATYQTDFSLVSGFEKIGNVYVPIDKSRVTIYRVINKHDNANIDSFISMTIAQLVE